MKKLLLPLLSVVVFSCFTDTSENPPGTPYFDGTGYRPVYISAEEVAKVGTELPRPLTSPGKIYVRQPYLFINEQGKGIHIINNADPKKPENLSFIAIPSNYDLAVKDNWLYADNSSDLLVFDISDPLQPKLSKRIEDAIPATQYPQQTGVYFECVNPEKGVVTGWEKINMEKRPSCYR